MNTAPTPNKKKGLRTLCRVLLILAVVILALTALYEAILHHLPAGASIVEIPDTILQEDVSFTNETSGLTMAGRIFYPQGFDETRSYPAVVVSGPMLSVKEQAQSTYAARMAEVGYVALVFDYTHFGDSEGEPRYLELPDLKAQDISSAVSFLLAQSYVDPERLYGIGICGSGSYMTYAATLDSRIRQVAVVVPATTMNTFIYEPLDQVAADREAYEAGSADPTYISLMSRLFLEGAAYYYNRSRGFRDNWSPRAVSWSEEGLADFYPEEFAKNLTQPCFVVTGSEAWSRSGAQALYENCPTEKDYLEIEGAGHFDLYDLDPYVSEAVDAITAFFDEHQTAAQEA